MCDASAHDMTPCTFEYWKDDEVGTTYEIHFVYFSAIGGGINEEETSMLIGRFGLAAGGRGRVTKARWSTT